MGTDIRALTGFIVVMVQFMNDTIGSFKVGWYDRDVPSDKEMIYSVFANPNTDGGMDLFFKGWQLPDNHDVHPACFLVVPQTSYLTASYEYYSVPELADIIQRNQAARDHAEEASSERMPFPGQMGRGYH